MVDVAMQGDPVMCEGCGGAGGVRCFACSGSGKMGNPDEPYVMTSEELQRARKVCPLP